jgi:hypothetical protein
LLKDVVEIMFWENVPRDQCHQGKYRMSEPHCTAQKAESICQHACQGVDFTRPEALLVESLPLMLCIRRSDAGGQSQFYNESQCSAKAGYPGLRDVYFHHRLTVERCTHEVMCERNAQAYKKGD